MADKTTPSSGLGFGSILTLIFVTLKLTHFINWSWWWVLSPEWISLIVLGLFFVVVALIMTIEDMRG